MSCVHLSVVALHYCSRFSVCAQGVASATADAREGDTSALSPVAVGWCAGEATSTFAEAVVGWRAALACSCSAAAAATATTASSSAALDGAGAAALAPSPNAPRMTLMMTVQANDTPATVLDGSARVVRGWFSLFTTYHICETHQRNKKHKQRGPSHQRGCAGGAGRR